eukprot:gene53-biopygen221
MAQKPQILDRHIVAQRRLFTVDSRSLLAGEQSDTLGLLRLNDRKSRHRRIKKQRRYERLAATSQLSLCQTPHLTMSPALIWPRRPFVPQLAALTARFSLTE